MKHGNFLSIVITGFFCLPHFAQATPLDNGCTGYYDGKMHKGVTITDVSASSIPSQDSCFYVELSDNTNYAFRMCPSATSNFSSILKMADTALLIQNPVNVCTSDEFLLGIEYTNN